MPPTWTHAPLLVALAGLSGCLGGSVSLEAEAPTSQALPLTDLGALRDLEGERLSYQVTFAGVPAGALTLWGTHEDGRSVLRLEGGTTGLLNLVHPVRATASSHLGSEGQPAAFQIWSEEDGSARARRIQFGDPTTLWWQEGARVAPRAVPMHTRARLDPLSFLWMLRSQPPEGTRDVEVIAGPRVDRYRVRYLGRAEVTVAAGDFPDSLAYEVEIRASAGPGEETPPRVTFELYLSGGPSHLPVLLRRSLSLGSLAVELSGAGALPEALPGFPLE